MPISIVSNHTKVLKMAPAQITPLHVMLSCIIICVHRFDSTLHKHTYIIGCNEICAF